MTIESSRADELILSVDTDKCSGCRAGCDGGTGLGQRAMQLNIANLRLNGPIPRPGDSLSVQLPSVTLIILSLLVYLLPLLLMLLFSVASEWFVPGADTVAAVSALLGLLAGFLIVKTVMREGGAVNLSTKITVLQAESRQRTPRQQADN